MEADPPAPGTPSVLEMLNQLWIKFLPEMEARVATLEEAARALAAGDLPSHLRDQAHSAAHKLAGTLGMFGLSAGTELAREAETLLAPESPLDPAAQRRLAQIVNDLRSRVRARA